jgi:hypothetical protein
LNAFILRFAGGVKAFAFSLRRWSLNREPAPPNAEPLKDQPMLKIRLFVLALAMLPGLCRTFGTTIIEDFSVNPFQSGWEVFGDTNLFQWNATNQNLLVTWDSGEPNSYFYHPLGTILTRDDDFSVEFNLQLTSIGPRPGPYTNTFEIAIGFLNLDEATGTNFLRGTGTDSPNLAELDYFWDSGLGATLYPAFVSTNSAFNYNGSSDYAIFQLATNDWYRITMRYMASNQTLVATITNFEQTSGTNITQVINTNFTDYRVGTFSISSYNDAGQDPQYAGSVLATCFVETLVVTVPDPPLANITGSFSNGLWQAHFASRTNWLYTLERTIDFQSWASASPTLPGTGSPMVLADTNKPTTAVFYRVRATRP